MTLGSIGMITLWVMDQLVFHRLLTSVFLVGLKMEKDDQEIPPIRSMMMKTQEGLGTHRWERLFYVGPVFVFVLISFVVIIGGSKELFLPNTRFFVLNTHLLSLSLGIFQLVAIAWMIVKFPYMSLKTKAAYFNDAEFTDLFADSKVDRRVESKVKSKFEIIISRFSSKTNLDM
jgi:hypothetical protein